MSRFIGMICVGVFCLFGLAGCTKTSSNPAARPSKPISWLTEGSEFEGVKFKIGYRDGDSPGKVIPLVAASKDGQSAADLMVFEEILEKQDEKQTVSDEATVYERSADGQSDVYVGSAKTLEREPLAVKFRAVLPSGSEWSEENWLPAKK